MSDFWADTRVLVTGGSGFVGAAVVRALDARGPAFIAAPRQAEYDLTRPGVAERLIADTTPDLVVHLAAKVGGIGANRAAPAEFYLDNLLMGTFLLEAARHAGVAKTVVAGTVCEYPKHTPVPFAETSLWDGYPEETNAPYGVAKKAMLVHGQVNRAQYGQSVIHVLPTNCYGPGDTFNPARAHVIPDLIRRFTEAVERGDDEAVVWGTGAASREFLYVDDAAAGIVAAAERYDDPEPLNLGSGQETTIKDLVVQIAELTGFTGRLVWDESKPDGQPRRCLDVSRAAETIGWRATMPFADGLRATVDWYRANKADADARL